MESIGRGERGRGGELVPLVHGGQMPLFNSSKHSFLTFWCNTNYDRLVTTCCKFPVSVMKSRRRGRQRAYSRRPKPTLRDHLY